MVHWQEKNSRKILRKKIRFFFIKKIEKNILVKFYSLKKIAASDPPLGLKLKFFKIKLPEFSFQSHSVIRELLLKNLL